MAIKNPTFASSEHSSKKLRALLEAWLPSAIVWAVCGWLLLSLVCFLLGQAD